MSNSRCRVRLPHRRTCRRSSRPARRPRRRCSSRRGRCSWSWSRHGAGCRRRRRRRQRRWRCCRCVGCGGTGTKVLSMCTDLEKTPVNKPWRPAGTMCDRSLKAMHVYSTAKGAFCWQERSSVALVRLLLCSTGGAGRCAAGAARGARGGQETGCVPGVQPAGGCMACAEEPQTGTRPCIVHQL